MDWSQSNVYRLPNCSHFCFHFLGHKKTNARDVFYLVISVFHNEFYFPEPLTQVGEEARLKEQKTLFDPYWENVGLVPFMDLAS